MKIELLKITQDLEYGTITENEARILLLSVLGINESSLAIDEIKNKHPYERWDNGAPMYICPKCKETEIGYGDNYCSTCGQKLEWHYH